MPTTRPARWLCVPLALAIGAGPVACRRAAAGDTAGVTLAGSTSLQPLAERWAEEYHDARVTVQAGGSTAGIRAAHDGTADVGMSSRPLHADERAGLVETVVAVDGIAIVVHPSNPVRTLTRAQLRALFAGAVRSWREVGGADAPVVVVTREEGSGTRATFEELAMPGARLAPGALVTAYSGGLRKMVADDPRAVGYMTIAQVGPGVRVVPIDGVAPSEGAIARGAYPLHRPLLFLSRPDPAPAARRFLAWVLSPAGQEVVRRERLVPVVGARDGDVATSSAAAH